MSSASAAPGRRIEISLRTIGQLFNSMDPSPFHERDLDNEAEEFLVSWAQEHPLEEPVTLVLHLREWPEVAEPERWIAEAIHHYFLYRAGLITHEFRRLMKLGRDSLAVGAAFLVSCLVLARLLAPLTAGTVQSVVQESLTIAGWVAMWRPMQIFLYDWWPLRRRLRVFQKMSAMPVILQRADARQK